MLVQAYGRTWESMYACHGVKVLEAGQPRMRFHQWLWCLLQGSQDLHIVGRFSSQCRMPWLSYSSEAVAHIISEHIWHWCNTHCQVCIPYLCRSCDKLSCLILSKAWEPSEFLDDFVFLFKLKRCIYTWIYDQRWHDSWKGYPLPSIFDGSNCLWSSFWVLLTASKGSLACTPGNLFEVVVTPVPFYLLVCEHVHKGSIIHSMPACWVFFLVCVEHDGLRTEWNGRGMAGCRKLDKSK